MLDAKIKKERVPDVYSRVAPLYDIWGWLTERDARQRCLRLADDLAEISVLTGGAATASVIAAPRLYEPS